MRLYATPDDLVPEWIGVAPEWMDTEPHRAHSLIRAASGLVEDATLLARYDIDDKGYPSDPRIAAAFRNAVCQQVAFWIAAKLDPNKGAVGQQPHLTSESAGSGSVSYSGVQTTQELGQAATTLSDAAFNILRREGLMRPQVSYLR